MKLKELKNKAESLNLIIEIEKKPKRWDYTLAIAKHYIKSHPMKDRWSFNYILEKESPMLAQRLNYLKPEEQEALFTSDNYFFDTKRDGVRIVIFYDPEYGFDFFSRNRSVTDCLPICYTDSIYISKHRPHGSDWKGIFNHKFIIDSELEATNPNVNTIVAKRGGVVTETPLQAVQALISLDPQYSIPIQKEQCQLTFSVFTSMFIKEDVSDFTEKERRAGAELIVDRLQQEGFPAALTIMNFTNKEKFYNDIINSGGEGVIVKRWDCKYHWTNSRGRDRWVKIKRNVQTAGDDGIEAFLSGATRGLQESNKDLMNSFEFSIFIKEFNGDIKEHIIGVISGLSLELKKKMTIINENGEPELNPEYLNKVATITGQAISSRELRLRHAQFVTWRPDRSKDTCIIDEDFLRKQVL